MSIRSPAAEMSRTLFNSSQSTFSLRRIRMPRRIRRPRRIQRLCIQTQGKVPKASVVRQVTDPAAMDSIGSEPFKDRVRAGLKSVPIDQVKMVQAAILAVSTSGKHPQTLRYKQSAQVFLDHRRPPQTSLPSNQYASSSPKQCANDSTVLDWCTQMETSGFLQMDLTQFGDVVWL